MGKGKGKRIFGSFKTADLEKSSVRTLVYRISHSDVFFFKHLFFIACIDMCYHLKQIGNCTLIVKSLTMRKIKDTFSKG